MSTRTDDHVLKLRVNRARDPDGSFTRAALEAQLGLDRALRGRRLWTAVLAGLSAPAALMLICPALMATELRVAYLVFWPAAALALAVNVVAVARDRRRVSAIDDKLGASPPRP